MGSDGEAFGPIPWIIFRAIFIDFIIVRVLLTLLLPGNGRSWWLTLTIHTIIFWTLPQAKKFATITKTLISHGVNDYAERMERNILRFQLAAYIITALLYYALLLVIWTALIYTLTVLPHLILQIELDLNTWVKPSRAEISKLRGLATRVLSYAIPQARSLSRRTLELAWSTSLWLHGQFAAHRQHAVTGFLQHMQSLKGKSRNGYQYQTLKDGEIRLLKFTPSFFGRIRCQIVHQSIYNLPHYEAISYTWGDPSKAHLLRIQPVSLSNSYRALWPLNLVASNTKWERIAANFWGVIFDLWPLSSLASRARWLLITANVRDILIDRASIFTVRYIWIDSLCINQADKDEKSKQVLLMQQIYSKATQTVIWLGHSPDADNAHQFLGEIVARVVLPQTCRLNSGCCNKRRQPKICCIANVLPSSVLVQSVDHPGNSSIQTTPSPLWRAICGLGNTSSLRRVFVFYESRQHASNFGRY
jgi:hypothetical protein